MSHDVHHQDPPESTNPLIWTIGLVFAIAGLSLYFAMNYRKGHAIGANHGHLPPAATSGPGEPNHAELIANRSDDVIDAGAVLYAKNCASCHGAEGDANPTKLNPPPRNFAKDSFKNPMGGGPYGLYTVLSKGYNGMPAFPSFTPEERYAVVHFVQERLVKPRNPDNYIVEDAKAIKDAIPAAGGASGPVVKPALRPVPDASYALMAGVAKAQAAEAQALSDWLGRAVDGAEGPAAEVLRTLAAGSTHAYAAQLARAIERPTSLKSLLLAPPPGVELPQAALMTEADFDHLIAQLRKAKPIASAGGN